MRMLIWANLITWLLAMAIVFCTVYAHKYTAGYSGQPLARRTDESLKDKSTAPQLIMFIHPNCPCANVSIKHFAKLVDILKLQAVIYICAEIKTDSQNWRSAEQIQGVKVILDSSSINAKKFGALTSGHVYLYSEDGKRLYDGGITAGRGHDGDNPGMKAILHLAKHPECNSVSMSVFGCHLAD